MNSCTIANQIIGLLGRSEEMQAAAVLNSVHADPAVIRLVLGFLLKYRLIEYDPRKEIIKLNKSLQFVKQHIK